MIKIRGRSLRLLGFAILAIAVAPFLVEIGLRIAACRSSLTDGSSENRAEIVASWTTHHQLAPLQRKQLEGTLQSSGDAKPQAVLFRTNSLGLRGRETEVPKPAGVYRIVLLGDESILGAATDESQTVAARLEHWLQTRSRMRIEVVNAGLPDSCPLLTYLRVRHGLMSLEPDLLLVDVNLSDIEDDRHFRRHTELAASGQPLAASHPELSAPKRSKSISENFLVVQHAEQLLASWLDEPQTRSPRDSLASIPATLPDNFDDLPVERISLTISPLEDLSRLVATTTSGLVIATHPTPSQLVRESRQDTPDLTSEIQQFAQQRGLLFCDATLAFRNATEKGSLFLSEGRRFSGELSVRGHEAYARALAVTLVEQLPGPWLPTRSTAQPRPTEPREVTVQPGAASPARVPGAIQPTSGLASPHELSTRPGGDGQFQFHNPNPPNGKRPELRPETRLAPISGQR